MPCRPATCTVTRREPKEPERGGLDSCFLQTCACRRVKRSRRGPSRSHGQGSEGGGGVSLRGSRPPAAASHRSRRRTIRRSSVYNIFAASLNARSPLKKAIRHSLSLSRFSRGENRAARWRWRWLGVGRIRRVAPYNLVFFLSWHSSLPQLDPENLPDTPEATRCNTRADCGNGRRASRRLACGDK